MKDNRHRYRVYDKEQKKYGLSVYMKNCGDGVFEVITPASSDNRFVVEQATEYCDKNEKQIFEHDIVKIYNGVGGFEIGFVMYRSGGFVVMSEYNMLVQISVIDCETKCEVIGNINEGIKKQ